MPQLKFSPSALNLFLRCPRCFWFEKKKGVKVPRGIFPSLPGGMDRVIKPYFDIFRGKGTLPPEIEGKVPGKLFSDVDKLDIWRSWRATDLCYKDKSVDAVLSGALDDCLVDGGYYLPLDYKTRGSELKSDPREYYQNQLDCYTLMLEASGFKTKGLAYLVYYWPLEAKENGMFKFHVETIKIETDINTAKKTVKDAALLLAGPEPKLDGECEYCWFASQRI
ncbi:PD-(D/E)XK nuclease family protein [Candidatus Omnitrophota bacterium]